MEALTAAYEPGSDVGAAVTTLLAWLGEHRSAATVFFVSSAGMSQEAEALRQESRTELLNELVRLIRKARESVSDAEAAVIGLGLLALLETAAISQVRGDDVYRSLGHRYFVREVGGLRGPDRRPGGPRCIDPREQPCGSIHLACSLSTKIFRACRWP
ncbi:hypothetical protein E4N62_47390 [Streptomyces sp. MNU76]|uniref:hypothetical protein n=1 Tax=Streptomyces sp. MNU76 TaxID=2560026 RepID=UPI001E42A1E4|nr:hypothetical protein [Streptomyces sp. MNU76]MCC9712178.1 hypothetical protein [Streptomyces sp. MNU76]